MKLISILLVAALVFAVVPGRSSAQLMTNPVYGVPQMSPSTAVIPGNVYHATVKDDYILGPGDKLEAHLIVGDNALVLDYVFVINPQGKIYFPAVAEIKLQGLTLKQAKEKIRREVKKKYRQKFTLSLMVVSPKTINVYVTGQSVSTGLKSLPDGARIADLLKAVGFARSGSDLTEYVYLKRQTGKKEFKDYKLELYDVFLGVDNASNILLRNGDIISVPAIRSYVYIYGDVSRSGTFGYVPGQRLSDYINIAGGPSARANLSGVTVTRQENGSPKVFHINASRIIQQGITDDDIEILPGDVINVPGNFFYFSDFASFANTVLLALTLYNTVVR